MAWTTPTLREVRAMVRDDVTSALSGAILIGNSVLRVISDANAGLAHLTLRYISWLAKQFLPDTSETEWLDRHGDIWLVNSDGSIGRKGATFASGRILFAGTQGIIIPSGTVLDGGFTISYETTEQIVIGVAPTAAAARALQGGILGNLEPGDSVTIVDPIGGVTGAATIDIMEGGTDPESDDELRSRVLFRIQQPPMGGDANDYVAWSLAVPGVTRAWSSVEMGIGTITVRFMMDDLRAVNNGFPTGEDIITVTNYIDSVRPVTLKDRFIVMAVPYQIDFRIANLVGDTDSIREAIEISVKDMLLRWAAPARQINGVQHEAQTIYTAWVSEAISMVEGVESFTLTMVDQPMPYNGSLAVLGTIFYDN